MPRLVPHPQSDCKALRSLSVEVGRASVIYVLEGDIGRLRIPAPRAPRVAEGLWRHTCCELFVGRKGSPQYREFNFSPSGEWAAYAFSRYREGTPAAERDPGIRVRHSAQRLELEARVALEGHWVIGLAAVIEAEDGALSYWALRHAPGKPDFHHPDAFALEFDALRR